MLALSSSPGLIGPVVDWLDIPQSARSVAALAGPLVIVGYLVGSIPFGYLLSRRRLRRQMHQFEAHLGGRSIDRVDVLAAALSAGAAVLATTLAWDVALAATPGSAMFSNVGTYANQVIGAWVSVALWTGMGVVVGHMGSVFQRFRGGSGLAPGLALAFVYAPLVFAAGTAVFLVANAISGDARRSLLVALPATVATEYWLWLADVQHGWGVTNGPELGLWVAALATALFARNVHPPVDVPDS